jgi:hypothetical protein
MTPRILSSALSVVCTISVLSGCRAEIPESGPYPTEEQVIADVRAIGVPYGRWVLFRDDDRLVALKVAARSGLCDRIHYWWAVSEPGSGTFPESEGTRGEGDASEEQFTGLISVPGLNLEWSRGSATLGWVYWPKDGRDFQVYSRPWRELGDVDPRSREGTWLEREQLRR